MKKNALSILLLVFAATSLFAEEQQVPDRVRRVELSGQWETDQKPVFYFQTVQPLYQDSSKENAFFVQPRVALQDDEYTYNMGLGYRRLAWEHCILGMNVFMTGIGLEALGRIWEMRVNGYIGVTEQREVLQATASTTYERVANGVPSHKIQVSFDVSTAIDDASPEKFFPRLPLSL